MKQLEAWIAILIIARVFILTIMETAETRMTRTPSLPRDVVRTLDEWRLSSPLECRLLPV